MKYWQVYLIGHVYILTSREVVNPPWLLPRRMPICFFDLFGEFSVIFLLVFIIKLLFNHRFTVLNRLFLPIFLSQANGVDRSPWPQSSRRAEGIAESIQ